MSAQPTTKLTFDAGSDVGRSRRGKPNEDSIGTYVDYCNDEARLAAKGKLFVVADGMGGAAGGREASSIAIKTVFRTYYDDPDPALEASLERAFQAANSEVQQYGRTHPELRGMGTTIAAAVLRDRTLLVGNVGDSRAYLLRGTSLQQLSFDHTMVMEQVREGVLLPDEAAVHPRRHVLSRNLGYRPQANPDFATWTILNDDAILLCSDGLWGPVGDDELARLLGTQRGKRAVKALIELANERGGPDNISAIVINVDSVAAGVGSATTEPVEQNDGSVTTEPGAPRPVPPLVKRAAKLGTVITEPIGPRPGAVTTEPAVSAPPVATPLAAPAATAPKPSVAAPRRSRKRMLPLLMATLVVLLGGGLLYRTLGTTGASVAALNSAETAALPARSAAPSAAGGSPSSAAAASGAASVAAQAVSSRAAAASASGTAASPSPEAGPPSSPAEQSVAPATAALPGFEVGAFPNTLALSPDGSLLAVGSIEGDIELLRASDGTPVVSVKAHDSAIASLAFSPDGAVLASASEDGTIMLWRVGSSIDSTAVVPSTAPEPELIRAPDQPSPEVMYGIGLDGQQLLYAGKQGAQILLWREDDELPYAALDGFDIDVQSLVFSPDGQSLAVVTRASTLQLRRAANGVEAGTITDQPNNMWSVAFVPGQPSIVMGIPNSSDPQQPHTVERRSFSFEEPAPGDQEQPSATAAAASPPVPGSSVPAEPVQLEKLLDLGKHAGGIVTVVFRDRQTLLSASRNGEIRQWTIIDAPSSPPAEASPPASGSGE